MITEGLACWLAGMLLLGRREPVFVGKLEVTLKSSIVGIAVDSQHFLNSSVGRSMSSWDWDILAFKN